MKMKTENSQFKLHLKYPYRNFIMLKTFYYLALISLSLQFISCNGCSKSGRNQQRLERNSHDNNSLIQREEKITANSPATFQKNVVSMTEENGIYKIPIEINGSSMTFIFDTGASIISISNTEAMFLYKQGTLTDDDILGKESFQDATGQISEGTIINLKTVKIGSKVLHNVQASVVHNNNAPILFGQSALAKFGKISIDYNRNEITFE